MYPQPLNLLITGCFCWVGSAWSQSGCGWSQCRCGRSWYCGWPSYQWLICISEEWIWRIHTHNKTSLSHLVFGILVSHSLCCCECFVSSCSYKHVTLSSMSCDRIYVHTCVSNSSSMCWKASSLTCLSSLIFCLARLRACGSYKRMNMYLHFYRQLVITLRWPVLSSSAFCFTLNWSSGKVWRNGMLSMHAKKTTYLPVISTALLSLLVPQSNICAEYNRRQIRRSSYQFCYPWVELCLIASAVRGWTLLEWAQLLH